MNDKNIRPINIDDYIGQNTIKENLSVFIKAAKMRDECLDHILLYGPPGLGKTTLAHIIANEMNTNIKVCSGPSFEKIGDLAAVLSALEEGDILFIDEIHRIPKFIEEMLYPALEDYEFDIIISNEGKSKSIKIDLPPFTLIGATTKIGNLTSPLRSRFAITFKFNFYNNDELGNIILRTSDVLGIDIVENAEKIIALSSRKTPRIANNLLKRIRDYACVNNQNKITPILVRDSLKKLEVNKNGLNALDIFYLEVLVINFKGGPVGIESISKVMNEDISTIEDVIEPFLIQSNYIRRTLRGRIALLKVNKVITKKDEIDGNN
ncbi:MAG: Holliday junction branch migration DNA helicase RuvB [bacterium]